jgi:hypothetical protein
MAKRTRERKSRRRNSRGRYSKKRYSKERYSKKRYSRKRYSRKRYSRKRYSKKRYSKKMIGGSDFEVVILVKKPDEAVQKMSQTLKIEDQGKHIEIGQTQYDLSEEGTRAEQQHQIIELTWANGTEIKIKPSAEALASNPYNPGSIFLELSKKIKDAQDKRVFEAEWAAAENTASSAIARVGGEKPAPQPADPMSGGPSRVVGPGTAVSRLPVGLFQVRADPGSGAPGTADPGSGAPGTAVSRLPVGLFQVRAGPGTGAPGTAVSRLPPELFQARGAPGTGAPGTAVSRLPPELFQARGAPGPAATTAARRPALQRNSPGEIPGCNYITTLTDITSQKQFDIYDAGGGGNCWFHVVAALLYSDAAKHIEVRAGIVQWVRDKMDYIINKKFPSSSPDNVAANGLTVYAPRTAEREGRGDFKPKVVAVHLGDNIYTYTDPDTQQKKVANLNKEIPEIHESHGGQAAWETIQFGTAPSTEEMRAAEAKGEVVRGDPMYEWWKGIIVQNGNYQPSYQQKKNILEAYCSRMGTVGVFAEGNFEYWAFANHVKEISGDEIKYKNYVSVGMVEDRACNLVLSGIPSEWVGGRELNILNAAHQHFQVMIPTDAMPQAAQADFRGQPSGAPVAGGFTTGPTVANASLGSLGSAGNQPSKGWKSKALAAAAGLIGKAAEPASEPSAQPAGLVTRAAPSVPVADVQGDENFKFQKNGHEITSHIAAAWSVAFPNDCPTAQLRRQGQDVIFNGTIDQFYDIFSRQTPFGHEQLEVRHDYIQWLFPTTEPSDYNLNSKVLSREDARRIRSDGEALGRIIRSLGMMANFYGFDLQEGPSLTFKRGLNYEERFQKLNTFDNHNFKRISRIFQCLLETGLNQYIVPFLDALRFEIFTSKLLSHAKDAYNKHWDKWRHRASVAAPGPSPPRVRNHAMGLIQLTAMGFAEMDAKAALALQQGDVDAALISLLGGTQAHPASAGPVSASPKKVRIGVMYNGKETAIHVDDSATVRDVKGAIQITALRIHPSRQHLVHDDGRAGAVLEDAKRIADYNIVGSSFNRITLHVVGAPGFAQPPPPALQVEVPGVQAPGRKAAIFDYDNILYDRSQAADPPVGRPDILQLMVGLQKDKSVDVFIVSAGIGEHFQNIFSDLIPEQNVFFDRKLKPDGFDVYDVSFLKDKDIVEQFKKFNGFARFLHTDHGVKLSLYRVGQGWVDYRDVGNVALGQQGASPHAADERSLLREAGITQPMNKALRIAEIIEKGRYSKENVYFFDDKELNRLFVQRYNQLLPNNVPAIGTESQGLPTREQIRYETMIPAAGGALGQPPVTKVLFFDWDDTLSLKLRGDNELDAANETLKGKDSVVKLEDKKSCSNYTTENIKELLIDLTKARNVRWFIVSAGTNSAELKGLQATVGKAADGSYLIQPDEDMWLSTVTTGKTKLTAIRELITDYQIDLSTNPLFIDDGRENLQLVCGDLGQITAVQPGSNETLYKGRVSPYGMTSATFFVTIAPDSDKMPKTILTRPKIDLIRNYLSN